MTEFTDEQIEEFMLELRPAMQAAGLSDSDFSKVRDQFTTPKFADEQVVANIESDEFQGGNYAIYNPKDLKPLFNLIQQQAEDLQDTRAALNDLWEWYVLDDDAPPKDQFLAVHPEHRAAIEAARPDIRTVKK